MERETGIEPATFSFGRWPSRIVQQRMFGQLATTAHSTRNLVTASVQRCAAQHPGRRAAETVCRQFQYPRLRFSRRHLRQIWLSWRHGLPLGTEIWGGEDAEFEPRCLRRTWRLSRFWLTTWKRSPSVSPSGTSFGSLHRRLRQQTVLRRLNTKHSPGKGPFAVRAAPVLSPWLPSVAPGSPGCGGRGVRSQGARCRWPHRWGLLLVPVLPGGRGKFLRRASPSSWAGARLAALAVAWLWWSTRRLFPRAPAQLSSTQSRSQPPTTPATTLRRLPPERKAPWKPQQSGCRRCPCRESPVVVLAAPPRRPCLPGRTPAPPCICRLSLEGKGFPCMTPAAIFSWRTSLRWVAGLLVSMPVDRRLGQPPSMSHFVTRVRGESGVSHDPQFGLHAGTPRATRSRGTARRGVPRSLIRVHEFSRGRGAVPDSEDRILEGVSRIERRAY